MQYLTQLFEYVIQFHNFQKIMNCTGFWLGFAEHSFLPAV